MSFFVYTHNLRHATTATTPFYVGKGDEKRAMRIGRNNYYRNVVKKYGQENVEVKFWGAFEEEQAAFAAEIELIAFLKEEGIHLTNLTCGGEGSTGFKWSKEQMVKHASRGWVGRSHTEESKKKIGDSCRGEKGAWFGKHLPAETVAKIAEKATGRLHSEETKKKLSELRKGKMVGDKHPMFGKLHSEESRAKMSASLKGRASPMKGKSSVTKNSIWLNDGVKNYRIPPEELAVYMARGFVKGIKQ